MVIFNSYVSLPEGIWENMMILQGKWGIIAQSIGLEVSLSFRGVPPCIIQVMDYHFIIKTYGDLGIPLIKKTHTYPYHPIHSQKVSHSDLTSVTPFHQLITSQLVQPQQKSTRICPQKMIHSSFSSQCHDTHVLITSSINSCCSSRKTSHYSGCFNPNTLG